MIVVLTDEGKNGGQEKYDIMQKHMSCWRKGQDDRLDVLPWGNVYVHDVLSRGWLLNL